jgi:serine phosphatase RsbU (regulator of sigma subunit)
MMLIIATSFAMSFGMLLLLTLVWAYIQQNKLKKQLYILQNLLVTRDKEIDIFRENNTVQHQKIEEQKQELREYKVDVLTQWEFMERKNNELEVANRRINGSINAAKAIQQAILPYPEKKDAILKDYFVIYYPKDVVSGDFYWLNQVNNVNILAVVDCTGHGVPGAFMSLIGNTLLDKIVRVWQVLTPADILSRLHQEIQIVLRQKENRNNYGMDISIFTWENMDNNIFNSSFAGAKRPLYYKLPNSNTISKINGTRKSIGGIQNKEIDFENHIFKLPQNTIIYMGTDGLEDQNNKERKRLGEKRLLEVLNKQSHLEMPIQARTIENTVKNYMKGTEQRDDILWIGFKIS